MSILSPEIFLSGLYRASQEPPKELCKTPQNTFFWEVTMILKSQINTWMDDAGPNRKHPSIVL